MSSSMASTLPQQQPPSGAAITAAAPYPSSASTSSTTTTVTPVATATSTLYPTISSAPSYPAATAAAAAAPVKSIIKSFIDSHGDDAAMVSSDDDNDSSSGSHDGEEAASLLEATAELAAASIMGPNNTSAAMTDDKTEENDTIDTNTEVIEDTSRDEASLASIKKIGELVDRKVFEMERVTKRVADHIVRLVALSWRLRSASHYYDEQSYDGSNGSPSTVSSIQSSATPTPTQSVSLPVALPVSSPTSLLTSVRQAKSMSNKLEYESGMAGEWLFAQLMSLDGISGSSIVKLQRKKMVEQIKAAITKADNIRGRAKRAALAFHSIIDHHAAKLPIAPTPTTEPIAPSAPSASSTPGGSPVAANMAAAAATEVKRSPQLATRSQPKAESKAKAGKAAMKKRDESLRWSPEFTSRELLDGVVISSLSSLAGVTPSSLKVNVVENKTKGQKGHVLVISGERTIKQRVVDDEATKALQRQYDEDRQAAGGADDDDNDDYSFGGFLGLFGGNRRPQRRPQQRRRVVVDPVTKVVEAQQWFEEKLQLPKWLSTDVSQYKTSLKESSGVLTIAIPKVQQPQSRSQRHHAAGQRGHHGGYGQHYDHHPYGYGDHDDEDEESMYEPSYSHHPAGYGRSHYYGQQHPSRYDHHGYAPTYGHPFGW